MLAQQNILCYNTPNNKIAVVESPELDLVAPRANAEGDAMNTTMSVSTQLQIYPSLLEVMVEVSPALVSISATPAIEDLLAVQYVSHMIKKKKCNAIGNRA